MLCEMCGSESAMLSSRKISGSVIQVCSSCVDLGSEPTHRESIGHRAYVAQTLQKRNMKRRYSDIEADDKVLISNYGAVVRKAREKLGIDHATLASKISEKKSIVTSVESGNMRPNEKLIKKLENFLKIRLMERVDPGPEIKSKKSGEGLTMGDLLKQAMEEN